MPVIASDIPLALREIATYFFLEGDRGRAKAYTRAAQTLDAVTDIGIVIVTGRLGDLPGIGPAISGVVEQLYRSGSIGLLERKRREWPKQLLELSRLPAVGVKKARALITAFPNLSLDEIAQLCERGEIRRLPGFGKVSEAKILRAIKQRFTRGELRNLVQAREMSTILCDYLRTHEAVIDVVIAGAVRRWLEIAESLSLVVVTAKPDAAREWIQRHPLLVSLEPDVSLGNNQIACAAISVLVARFVDGGIAHFFLTDEKSAGPALIFATGSPNHVAQLEMRAKQAGTSLGSLQARNEAETYHFLGLPWFPPEVRDGTDEIDFVEAGGTFSDLVTVRDVRGAVHCHTVYSDGKDTISAMANAAQMRNLDYMTITDHSASAAYARGLSEEDLMAQWQEITETQKDSSVRILRGIESDILVDGALDYDSSILENLEVVIASIHRRHKLSAEAMTERLVAAMRLPIFKIWGHAFGRILLHRDPIACDFDQVLQAVVDSPCAIEINGDPHRLDIDPDHARQAQRLGVKFVVSSDAHSTRGLDNLNYAVAMARRARLRPASILNTLDAEQFVKAVRPSKR